MAELARTRRRLEAVSLRLLKCSSKLPTRMMDATLRPREPSNTAEATVLPESNVEIEAPCPAPAPAAPVNLGSSARAALDSAQEATLSHAPGTGECLETHVVTWSEAATFNAESNGELPAPTCPQQMSTMRAVHMLTAEATWAGLNGVNINQSALLEDLRKLDRNDAEAVDWLSITFFAKAQVKELEIASSDAAAKESDWMALCASGDSKPLVYGVASPIARHDESVDYARDEVRTARHDRVRLLSHRLLPLAPLRFLRAGKSLLVS